MSQLPFSNIDTTYIKDFMKTIQAEVHDLNKSPNELLGRIIKLHYFINKKITHDPVVDPLVNLMNAIHISQEDDYLYLPISGRSDHDTAVSGWKSVLWLFESSTKKFAATKESYNILVAGLAEGDVESNNANTAYQKLVEDFQSVSAKLADITESIEWVHAIIVDELNLPPTTCLKYSYF